MSENTQNNDNLNNPVGDNYPISKSQVRRDYQDKNFANPYFSKENPKPKFNTKYYLKVLFVIFLVYIFIYSDLFKIKNITVTGTEMINQNAFIQTVNQNISSYKWFLFPRRNIFFFSKKRLSNNLNSAYNLEQLKIKRGLHTLSIIIKEKVSYVIIYNLKNQSFFFVGLDGAVNQIIPREAALSYMEMKKFPILNISEESEIKIGDNLITPKMASYIIELDKYLKNQPINIQGYEQRGIEEISLVAKEGWRAYFDINSDIKTSIESLLLIKNKIGKNKFQYIDLRFGDKVFYK